MQCAKSTLLIRYACYAALLIPCLSYAHSSQPQLRLQGSNTIGAQLAPALLLAMLSEQGLSSVRQQTGAGAHELRVLGLDNDAREVVTQVIASGSGTGFHALAEAKADIALSSRPIKHTEAIALADLGSFPSAQTEHVIGLDALAIIVHSSNPISQLNTQQLAALFAGEIRNWQQLGGADLAVSVHARDDNSGTYDTFNELLLKPNATTLVSDAKRYQSSRALTQGVAHDEGAIGFVGLPDASANKTVAIASGDSRALLPQPELVATEDYPLSRRLFFYTPANTSNTWREQLIRFTHSEHGQQIVADSGFVAQTVQVLAPEANMSAHYRQLSPHAQRLSVNFRFQQGLSALDHKAAQDVERLVHYLKRHSLMNRRVVLVGFGDSNSNQSRSQLLSKLRAMAVRKALVERGVFIKEVIGFGDSQPVASNEDASGRARNRRVEVWID